MKHIQRKHHLVFCTATSFAAAVGLALLFQGLAAGGAPAAVRASAGEGEVVVPTYTLGTLPAPGRAGRLARLADGARGLWMDTGSSWVSISSETVNVREFGARGDGRADDTAAFQQAYAAARSRGSSLHIPAGTYVITDELIWDAAVDVRGASMEHTILLKAKHTPLIRIEQSGQGAMYENFSVDSKPGMTGDGIDIWMGGRITMRRISVANQGGHGILIRGGNLGHYQELRLVRNRGDGIRVTGFSAPYDNASWKASTNACTFVNIDVRINGGHGFNLHGHNADFNYGMGIVAQGNRGDGVRIGGLANHLQVYGESNRGYDLHIEPGAIRNMVVTNYVTSPDKLRDAGKDSHIWDNGSHNTLSVPNMSRIRRR